MNHTVMSYDYVRCIQENTRIGAGLTKLSAFEHSTFRDEFLGQQISFDRFIRARDYVTFAQHAWSLYNDFCDKNENKMLFRHA